MKRDITRIQKSIEQIGLETVTKYLPKGMKLCQCDMHGGYLAHYTDKNPLCPLCQVATNAGNGTTASEVELYIDLHDMIQNALGND